MKRTHIIASIFLFMYSISIQAQTAYLNDIATQNISISKKAGVSSISMDLNLDDLHIDKNQMIVITPVIVSLNDEKNTELSPIYIVGTKRDKMLNRPFQWKGKTVIDPKVANTLVRKNGEKQQIHYSQTTPYAPWQRAAKLVFNSEVIGCADCVKGHENKVIVYKILPDLFMPDYQMNYIVPEVEQVKQRSERYTAHFNYVVGRWNLLPNFENNAAELAKVDKYIRELRSDKDLTITDFTISGYASPEDTEARNLMLSQRRAETFAGYIEKKYGYKRSQIKVEWFGEDWKGLRQAIVNSKLENKNTIIEIIDNNQSPDAKDAQLIALDNGKTYSRLLTEFYPALRRNDYELAFISRAFNVEEAKEVIKKNPKKLSLNEMFLVANTYPEGSAEYNEVFYIAARTFPNSEIANINAAINELKANRADDAIARLQKWTNSAVAQNILGIAYAQKGDTNQAAQYFAKAAQAGNQSAMHNATQLQLYIDDNR